ncbi:MAG: hypothetical protein WC728_18645 [Elusimicrobiota bacterium]
MLRAGRAMLFMSGLRPIDGRQHKTVVEVAAKILGRGHQGLCWRFEQMRRMRNQSSPVPEMHEFMS